MVDLKPLETLGTKTGILSWEAAPTTALLD